MMVFDGKVTGGNPELALTAQENNFFRLLKVNRTGAARLAYCVDYAKHES